MEILRLPRRSRRKKSNPLPRSWKHAPLISDRAPKCEAHVWRLGPDHHELERVIDRRGQPVALDGHAHEPALRAVIHEPGFYRVVLRDKRGFIRARRDYEAAFHFSADWDPKTARKGYTPRTTTERLAAERDAMKARLAESEAARVQLEAERDTAHTRIAEVERNAEIRVGAVRAAAAEQVAAAQAERAALETLLTRKLDELARVRALYMRLVEAPDDAPADEAVDTNPPNADERLDLERLADKLVGCGERLGLFGAQERAAPDDTDDR